MLVDELKELLKTAEPEIITIKTFWEDSTRESQYKELLAITEQPDFWQNPDQIAISKKLQVLKDQRESYQKLISTYNELSECVDLFADDQEELLKLTTEIKRLPKKINIFKVSLILNQPHDESNCFLSINAGAGGTESQDWASILLRMYTRFCEREKLESQLIDYQAGEEAGIKSATLYIKGKNAFGLLKTEQGIHRLVRISPFDANKRRHTSFAAVHASPELPEIEITINPDDLRIDTYRAGGAGGQHVNKTDSAVRITHMPSGIVTQCQSERSQTQNKETAMKMLKAKLYEKQKEEENAKAKQTEKKKIEWGSQIRSYVLHPYKMVKDHRTDIESGQPDKILDGDIMEFIEAYLLLVSKQ